ncbi:MAG: DEAD/DEAH box helicase [Thermoanaerobacteraceae bacterium]|nr:DEAD/DEAH box helicase [Thermoanaerobacteraceae bacterium]
MYRIINELEIKRRCFDTMTYKKGLDYYNSHKIKDLKMNQTGDSFDAVVLGSKAYNVSVKFYESKIVTDCTCPAKQKFRGDCKHIICVLIYLSRHRKDIEDFLYNNLSNEIFKAFENNVNTLIEKQPVNIEVIFEKDLYARGKISFKIGMDKLYIVKSIRKLFSGIENGEPVEFGKNFAFIPAVHTFKDEDMPLINFVREVYEIDKIDAQNSYYRAGSIFDGKHLILTSTIMKRFFDIMKERPFNAVISNQRYDDVKILNEDVPIEFKLSKNNNGILLGINGIEKIRPLNENGSFLFYDGNIYNVSEKQQKVLMPFYAIHLRKGINKINFKIQDKPKFESLVLPHIEKNGNMVIDDSIKSLFCKETLTAKIYFDKEKESITADINFNYGKFNINHYNPSKNITDKNAFLIRDIEKERNILDIFERAKFKIKESKVYLDTDDDIFDFIFNGLPELQKYAEVYYSDEFKKLRLNKNSFGGSVRLSEEGLLEFDFSIDEVDNNILPQILASFRKKKKYFKLPNGAFLPLDAEFGSIINIMDSLEIPDKELKKGGIKLPKYKALYLDEKLKNSNISIERNLRFKELVQNVIKPQDMDFEIPANLKGVLRKYQITGYKWLKTLSQYGFGGILADDMGLGKTIQAIAFLLSEKEKVKGPAIVICPTSLLYNWESEIENFAPSLKTLVISGNKSVREILREQISTSDVVITSYPLIRRDIEFYEKIEFTYCIIDEAQHIKNPLSQNAESVKKIKAKGYFALTGTPIENSLSELWSIFDFLMPGYLLSHRKFVEKYEKPIVKNSDKNVLTDFSKHIQPFILRRVKKDVLKELPQKIETISVAELTKEQKELYLAYLKNAKGEIETEIASKGFERSRIKILSALTRLRQICCHPSMFTEEYKGESGKMELLLELLQELKAGSHRVLLFSQFTTALKLIEGHLKKEKITYLYLDGSVKSENRGEIVKAFNNGDADVFLISLKAGGTGLNLTGADTVIHFDPWWNPAVEDQATDRAHRIGQENTVQVIKLITHGTIEEKIIKLQKKKKEMINSVINSGETFISKLSEEEIKALFVM